MQTFQSLLAERWLGSLKPMVLSNCSYLGETETGCYRHILPQGTCQDLAKTLRLPWQEV